MFPTASAGAARGRLFARCAARRRNPRVLAHRRHAARRAGSQSGKTRVTIGWNGQFGVAYGRNSSAESFHNAAAGLTITVGAGGGNGAAIRRLVPSSNQSVADALALGPINQFAQCQRLRAARWCRGQLARVRPGRRFLLDAARVAKDHSASCHVADEAEMSRGSILRTRFCPTRTC